MKLIKAYLRALAAWKFNLVWVFIATMFDLLVYGYSHVGLVYSVVGGYMVGALFQTEEQYEKMKQEEEREKFPQLFR